MPFKMKYKNLKEVVEQLDSAVVAHGKQARTIEKHLDSIDSPAKSKLKPCQKAAAKRKFKVYPSAYANMWASRYKC